MKRVNKSARCHRADEFRLCDTVGVNDVYLLFVVLLLCFGWLVGTHLKVESLGIGPLLLDTEVEMAAKSV